MVSRSPTSTSPTCSAACSGWCSDSPSGRVGQQLQGPRTPGAALPVKSLQLHIVQTLFTQQKNSHPPSKGQTLFCHWSKCWSDSEQFGPPLGPNPVLWTHQVEERERHKFEQQLRNLRGRSTVVYLQPTDKAIVRLHVTLPVVRAFICQRSCQFF